ncbi:uncharacterized protein [Procambarus clarkii]|uniref:uncharacterized protein n=1 Tax=Procambarus clarkii TaxID=6728 RepID=UPI0037434C2C
MVTSRTMAQMWKQLVVVTTVAVTISWAGPLEHSKQHAPHPPVSHLPSKTSLPVNIPEKSQPVSEIIAPSAKPTQVKLPSNAQLVREIIAPSAETTQVKKPSNAELVSEIIAPSAETTQVKKPSNAELVSEIIAPSAETTQVKKPSNAELVSEIIAPSAETTQVKKPSNAELVSEIIAPSAETTQVKLPINAKPVREIRSNPIIQNIKAPSNIQAGPAYVRNNDIQPCTHEGIFGIPNNCDFFLICRDKSTTEQYTQQLYKCIENFSFNEIKGDCVNEQCPSHVFNDPGMPAPPSQFQIPEWLNTLPSWFNSTPWWFKTPPAWFHTAPAWFNAPLKSQILEEIKTEGEGVFPETITKDVIFGANASINGRGNAYYDNKTLNIHIPIKIVQN